MHASVEPNSTRDGTGFKLFSGLPCLGQSRIPGRSSAYPKGSRLSVFTALTTNPIFPCAVPVALSRSARTCQTRKLSYLRDNFHENQTPTSSHPSPLKLFSRTRALNHDLRTNTRVLRFVSVCRAICCLGRKKREENCANTNTLTPTARRTRGWVLVVAGKSLTHTSLPEGEELNLSGRKSVICVCVCVCAGKWKSDAFEKQQRKC